MTNAIKLNNMDKIEALIKAGAMFAVSHSGGKDSQAMYIALSAVIPAEQIVVIHADLGEVEWQTAQDHINATISHPLHIATAIYKDGSNKGILDMVLRRWVYLLDKHARINAEIASGKEVNAADRRMASLPVPAPWFSSTTRFCTSDGKRDPIAKVFKRLAKERGDTIVVNCTGIRSDESTARSNKIPFEVNKRASSNDRAVYNWMPIFDMTTEDVFTCIKEAGQKPHAMYAKGMSRFSCCFCFMARKADLTIAAREACPKLYAKYVAIERVTGFTMIGKKSLEAITGIPADAALIAAAIAEIEAQGYTTQADEAKAA